MTERPDLTAAEPLAASLVRLVAGRTLLGTGFALPGNLVATCAHVVASVDDVSAQFPLLGPEGCAAEVVERDDANDVAILRLLDPPADVLPTPVRLDTDVLGHRFRVPGFTAAEPDGVWAEGHLAGHQGAGRIQMAVDPHHERIVAGFSGGPVWDQELRGVVGMVVTRSGNTQTTAHLVPISFFREWVDSDRNPYLGLKPFQEADAALFHGRDDEVGELLGLLARQDMVAIAGPSGSGKSSLVRAGLLPQLKRTGVTVVELGSGEDIPASGVLFLDQFEEEVVADPEGARGRLEQVIQRVAEQPRTPGEPAALRVVLTLRSRSLDDLITPDTAAQLNQAVWLLKPMRPEKLREAIVRPAESAGLAFEVGLLDTILHDCPPSHGTLSLLSEVLQQLWQQRQGVWLTHAAYQELGRVPGALSKRADDVFTSLRPAEAEAAKRLLTALTRPDGEGGHARRSAHLDDLDPELRAIAHELAAKRLVTIREQQVELPHQALIDHWPTLRGWLAEDADFLTWQAKLHDLQNSGGQLRNAPLAEASEWLRKRPEDVPAQQRFFIRRSEAAQRRTQRRWRTITAIVGVLALVAVVLTGVALDRNAELNDQLHATNATFLAQAANRAANGNPVQALQLALAAWREKPGNVDAFGALFQQRLYWHEVDRVLTQPQFRDVRTMESSADGRVVVLIPNNPFTKPTVWWDLLSPDARHREISADPRSYFVLSPDGRMLAVSDQAHGLRIWDLNQPGEPIVLDPRVTWDPSFSADGRFLALSSETNPEHVRVWDLDGMREIRTQVSYARTNPVPTGGFYPSPDGRSLVATEYKRDNLEGEHVYEAVVRDLMTGAEIRSFPMSDDAEVRLLGNGTQVAICTGGELTLYDVFSDTPNRQFRVPNCFITLDASGRYIEDSAYNQILDWKDGTELTFGTSAFPDMWTEAEPLLSRAPDGTFNAISNRDGVLQVYALVPRPGHVERLDTWSLLTFANDRGMSWVSYNGFDPGTGQGEIALLGSDGGVLSRRPVPQEPEGMAFDASGDRLAVAMGTKLLIYRTDGLVLEHEARLPVPEGRTDDDLARSDGGSVAPTLDGRILVSRMGILSFWDPQFAVQTAPPLVLENPTQWDRVPDGPNVALRPGHPEQLLVQSRNKFAVWDLRERRQLREFQLGELSSLAVSENGSVAALPTGSMITLVDLRNMTALPPLNSQGTKIIGINGDYLFAKDTQTLQVWHWPTYRQVTSMDLPRDASQGIVGNKFFPDREPGRQEPISLDAAVWFRDLCRIGDREFTVQDGLLPPGASAEPPCR